MHTEPRLGVRTRQREVADCFDYLASKALRQKAVVDAIGTGTAGKPLRRTPQVFADILNEQTVLGKMRAFGLTVDAPPFAFIPTVSDTPSTAWVAEGAKIPLARAGFSTARTARRSTARCLPGPMNCSAPPIPARKTSRSDCPHDRRLEA